MVLYLADITSRAYLKQFWSSNTVNERSVFVCFIYQKLPFTYHDNVNPKSKNMRFVILWTYNMFEKYFQTF